MPDRYYSALPIDSTVVTLDGNEAHHLLHVMRAQPGMELIVFDGLGGQFDAEVVKCNRSTAELTVGERNDIERELPYQLTLAVALPKGDRQRWLVEKAVELGVTRLISLQTSRSVSKAEKSAKLARYVIEASKQCGRNRLMQITPPQAWTDLAPKETDGIQLFAHPGGSSLSQIDLSAAKGDAIIAVGPEGGFTDDELAIAINAGWQTVGLGDRILRIETAALAIVSGLTMRLA